MKKEISLEGMASTIEIEKKSCPKCPKDLGQVLCGGCGQWFCWKHLSEHRQDVIRQMDDLVPEYDQLQKHLNGDATDFQQHPFMNRVDRWESKSIERIRQIANEVRSRLRESLARTKINVRHSLKDITEELKKHREMETFTEIELQQWMSQLRELKEELDKPPTIELIGDEAEPSSTHLPLIQLRTIQRRKGKCEL